MTKLPTGVRQRGSGFEYYLMVDGKRHSRICDTLEEAVLGRRQAKEALKQGGSVSSPNIWTLKEAYERTAIQWHGTKSEDETIHLASMLIPWFGASTKVNEINNVAIMDFIAYCQNERGNSSATVNRKLAWLSKVLRTALNGGSLVTLPSMLREGKQKEYRGRDRYLTDTEESLLLKTAKEMGYQDVVEVCIVLIDTGMRTGELWKISRADFNPSVGQNGVLSICDTKGNRNRAVPLTKRASAIVAKRCLDNPDQLFPYSTDWIRPRWKKIKVKMGMSEDQQLVPHCLRHTCATRLVSRGIPINVVQQWLGHSSIQMTARYSHLAPSQLFEAMSVLESDLRSTQTERRKSAVN